MPCTRPGDANPEATRSSNYTCKDSQALPVEFPPNTRLSFFVAAGTRHRVRAAESAIFFEIPAAPFASSSEGVQRGDPAASAEFA